MCRLESFFVCSVLSVPVSAPSLVGHLGASADIAHKNRRDVQLDMLRRLHYIQHLDINQCYPSGTHRLFNQEELVKSRKWSARNRDAHDKFRRVWEERGSDYARLQQSYEAAEAVWQEKARRRREMEAEQVRTLLVVSRTPKAEGISFPKIGRA